MESLPEVKRPELHFKHQPLYSADIQIIGAVPLLPVSAFLFASNYYNVVSK
jgi:hypothetical protein